MNKILKIVGIIILVLVGLSIFGNMLPDQPGDGRLTKAAVEYAISPWGDEPEIILNDTVLVSLDVTDGEFIEHAMNQIWRGAFGLDAVESVTIYPYRINEDGEKQYLPAVPLTREEWGRSN